ncbi:hypothetical protein ILYODFUR_028043 [Ilyodon furcidens]|uniref:Uncharacterized protein n=1 Tax=Ilyodon furcidens TaxID=33524 RepID=A0ABV0VI97_9TELE
MILTMKTRTRIRDEEVPGGVQSKNMDAVPPLFLNDAYHKFHQVNVFQLRKLKKTFLLFKVKNLLQSDQNPWSWATVAGNFV